MVIYYTILNIASYFRNATATLSVSAKYMSDKSSKNWFSPVKIEIGPVKN